MVNRRKLFTCIFFLIFAAGTFISAQERKFSQQLSWVADKNAFDYKVEIRGVDSDYKSLLESEKTFVEVSLPAGEYKYRVYAFDFLGRQASVSDWRNFTVIKALPPKIENTTKEVVPVKGEEKITIPVEVQGIETDSTVVLVNTETKKEVKGKLEVKTNEKKELVASEAVFPQLDEGNWVMKVTNPSGLSTESEKITVEPQKTRAQIAAEKKAEEDRIAAEKKAEEDRITAEKKAAEEKKLAEKRAEEERIAAEKAAEEKRLAEERRIAEEKLAAQRKAEEERLAAEKKAEEERKAEEKLAKAEAKKNKPAADFTMLFGGGCSINLYGMNSLFKGDTSNTISTLMDYMPAVDLRIGWLPIKSNGWKTGFEITGVGAYGMIMNEYIRADFPILINQFNLVLQRQLFTPKFLLSLKIGGSIFIIEESFVSLQDENAPFFNFKDMQGIAGPGVQGGVSLVLIPTKHFEMELGADFNHLFSPDMSAGCINSYLVMGVRL